MAPSPRLPRASSPPGQVAVILVLFLAVLLLFAGFAVDLGGSWWMRTGYDAALEGASQASFAQANEVKYAANPGDAARDQVIEVLEGNGFTGTATIWYAEAPASESGPSDRYCGIKCELRGTWGTFMLAAAGTPEIEVASSRVWVLHPYSTATVWRPAATGDGWVRVEMSDGSVTGRSSGSGSLSSAPEDLRAAVEDAASAP